MRTRGGDVPGTVDGVDSKELQRFERGKPGNDELELFKIDRAVQDERGESGNVGESAEDGLEVVEVSSMMTIQISCDSPVRETLRLLPPCHQIRQSKDCPRC